MGTLNTLHTAITIQSVGAGMWSGGVLHPRQWRGAMCASHGETSGPAGEVL